MVWIVGAYHTSVVALSWTMFCLAQHPDVQAKVRAEVDALLPKGRSPAYDDLERLPYTTQVVKESMRLFTPGPFAARLVDEDTPLGDRVLPAGTTLFYPLSVIHTNPSLWPEPDRFDPERFSPEAVRTRHPQAYVPFGVGPRICPGERFAWLEIKLLLALIVQHFTFELAMPVADVVPTEKFVLFAKDDIRIRLHRRQ
eukprot:TRINITY_DN4261_c0_g1_i2.p2 TRINITY_DN4261_c0_g1~~TRINITY_DN4261_c0_g1_i2.p2  ORF type:complete len:198 (+),score=64.68 TRINITY_DN4261_c0_g1_i2:980-1573(+)